MQAHPLIWIPWYDKAEDQMYNNLIFLSLFVFVAVNFRYFLIVEMTRNSAA